MQTPDIGAIAHDVEDLKRRVERIEKKDKGIRKLEDEEDTRFTVKEGAHRLIEKAPAGPQS